MPKPKVDIDYNKALAMLSNYVHTILEKKPNRRSSTENSLIREISSYRHFLGLSKEYQSLTTPIPLLLEMNLRLKRSLYYLAIPHIPEILVANNFPYGSKWEAVIANTDGSLSWDDILEDEVLTFSEMEDDNEEALIVGDQRLEKLDRIIDLFNYVQTQYDIAGGLSNSSERVRLMILELERTSDKIMPKIIENISMDSYVEDSFFEQFSEETISSLDSYAQSNADILDEFKDEVDRHYSNENSDSESDTTEDSELTFSEMEDDNEEALIVEDQRLEKLDRIMKLFDYVQTQYDCSEKNISNCSEEVRQMILELKITSALIMPKIIENISMDSYVEDSFFEQFSEDIINRLDDYTRSHAYILEKFKAEVEQFASNKNLDSEGYTSAEGESNLSPSSSSVKPYRRE